MDAKRKSEPAPMKNQTMAERKSERELIVRRTFHAPASIVFEAWSKAELFQRWWIPKSIGMSLVSCAMDVRTGGSYRLAFNVGAPEPMEFFGKYIEVVPNSRIVWTNEESAEASVTTVTFEERGGNTLLTLTELFPSKAALDEAMAGSAAGYPEQFEQLDELLVTLGANVAR